MELWTILVGAIAMLVIQGLKNQLWPEPVKVILSLVVCVILSAIQWAAQRPFNTLTWDALLLNTGEVFAVAVVLYKGYFSGTGWMQALGGTKIL